MKLSTRLLFWHLYREFTAHVPANAPSDPVLQYAAYYTGESSLSEGVVYVVPADAVPPLDDLSPRMALVIAEKMNAAPPSDSLSSRIPSILTSGTNGSAGEWETVCRIEGASCAAVLNCLNRLFARYEEWQQQLLESRLQSGSIQRMIDLTGCVISNPMAVVSMDFTVIAAKGRLRRKAGHAVLGADEESLKIVNALKQDENYAQAVQHQGVFYFPGNSAACPSLCVNIRRSGRTGYRLLVTEGDIPLDATFGFILERLAELIGHALSSSAVSRHRGEYPFRQLFTSLLTDARTDYVEVSQHLTSLGWLSSHHYQCLLIQTGPLDYKNLTLRSICGYLENAVPASCAVEHNGNAVVYINLTLCPLSQEDIPLHLAGFLQESMLSAGMSRALLGHFNFYRQYIQASIALKNGQRLFPGRWLHPYNDVAFTYLLEQATQKLPGYMVCHEQLLHLKYMSAEGTVPLYQTLRAYLENQQNVAKTARELYIHRSTLLYRLEKIREVLHSDLSDPEEILYLLLSFRIMDREEPGESPG